MTNSCLVDLTRCIGCRGCQVACKQWNGLTASRTRFFTGDGGYQNPPSLSSETYTLVGYTEVESQQGFKWVFAKRQCMHCLDPACHSACPVEALHISATGAVVYDSAKCLGCRYCMMACPFGVPTFEWAKAIPYIRKCTFCLDRQTNGSVAADLNSTALETEEQQRLAESYHLPSCAKACPTGAVKFGDRDSMLSEARQRMAANPGRYVDKIYGEHEVGGTNWLYMSAVPFEQLGFPATETIGTRAYPEYTRSALGSVPYIVIAGGAVLGGLYWIYQRKQELSQQTETVEKESKP